MASKRAREQQVARPARRAQLDEFPYCEPQRAGLRGDCFGKLTVHEPWTRARGGPLGDRRNQISACQWHNDELTQSPHGMVWGLANGYLVSATDGSAWLDAGGFGRDRIG